MTMIKKSNCVGRCRSLNVPIKMKKLIFSCRLYAGGELSVELSPVLPG